VSFSEDIGLKSLPGFHVTRLKFLPSDHLESIRNCTSNWATNALFRNLLNLLFTDYPKFSSPYNVSLLLRVKEQRNILHEICKRKANWIGHILRRNCLLQRVIDGKIQEGTEVTGRQRRRRRKLLYDLNFLAPEFYI
jgi:hypothetical protein